MAHFLVFLILASSLAGAARAGALDEWRPMADPFEVVAIDANTISAPVIIANLNGLLIGSEYNRDVGLNLFAVPMDGKQLGKRRLLHSAQHFLDETFNIAAYGNGKYVLVPDGVLVSDDGLNWRYVLVPGRNFEQVTFGNGIFLASALDVSSRRFFLRSVDGVNWTEFLAATLGDVPRNTLNFYKPFLHFGKGRFICLWGGGIYTSTDAISWQKVVSAEIWTPGQPVTFDKAACLDGRWVVSGYYTRRGVQTLIRIRVLLWSDDAVRWTQTVESPYSSSPFDDLVAGNGYFFGRIRPHIYYSQDGLNWRESSAPVDQVNSGPLLPMNGYFAIGRAVEFLRSGPVLEIVEPPQHTFGVLGQDVEITSRVQGEGQLSFQWYKENQIIPGATNVTLSIPQAKDSDAGHYQLSVSNTRGLTQDAEATLTVGPAFLKIETGAQTKITIFAPAGKTAILEVQDRLDPGGSWTALFQTVMPSNSTTFEGALATQKFFRLRVL